MDLGVAVLALALVDCSPAAPPATPQPRPVPLGQEFVLGPGQTARVEGLEIRFDQVKDDSRCPVDVTCVWAGDATVVVTARRGAETRELEMHATMSPRDVTYGGFKIALVKLLPVRRSTQNVTPGDYRATLSVSRPTSNPSPSPSPAP